MFHENKEFSHEYSHIKMYILKKTKNLPFSEFYDNNQVE